MIQLRDYQQDLINRTRTAMTSYRNVLLQSATGSGKTALTVFMMKTAADRGKTAMFIVHQTELLKQTSAALWRQQLEHGMICPGKKKSRLPVQVASVQTLVRRLEQHDAPDLIIIDEAHRAAAATYQRVIEAYPRARVIGLTATPARTDGRGLDDLFETIIEGPSMRDLIDRGFLCDYDLIAPPINVDMSAVRTKMGDFDKKQTEEAMDKPTITGDAVAHYKKFAAGKRCVVMCVSVKHATHVAEQYVANGIRAEVIEGTLTEKDREGMIERFRTGETKVVCSIALLTEGVDIPAIEVVQWLRPTQSLIVWLQGIGRGLRPSPGKERLLILDHVANWHRHGIPDQDREWKLEGREKGKRKKKDEDEAPPVQQCQECYHVFAKGPTHCPACGNQLPGNGKAELEVVEGELDKIDLDQVRRERKREQGQARTLRELVELGVRRGMNKPAPWAAITLAGREGRKPTPQEFGEAKRMLVEVNANTTKHEEAF